MLVWRRMPEAMALTPDTEKKERETQMPLPRQLPTCLSQIDVVVKASILTVPPNPPLPPPSKSSFLISGAPATPLSQTAP